jgi:hypothetical protein
MDVRRLLQGGNFVSLMQMATLATRLELYLSASTLTKGAKLMYVTSINHLTHQITSKTHKTYKNSLKKRIQ